MDHSDLNQNKFILKQMSRKRLIKACRKMIQILDFYDGTLRQVALAESKLDNLNPFWSDHESLRRGQEELSSRYESCSNAQKLQDETLKDLLNVISVFCETNRIKVEE